MRYKLISCEVLFREMCSVVARSPHQVDVEFLPKGLHDYGGATMCAQLQQSVDGAVGYDAVLMGYALCGNGIVGLHAREAPLVIPRAHDCIALLMGSRQKYQQHFEANSGVYYRSTGWLERGKSLNQQVGQQTMIDATLADLIAKYGEDNGRYLFEELHHYQSAYSQLTFIATGLECDSRFEQEAREEAAEKKWRFERIVGSLDLFARLVNGDWDADFLVVPPGASVVPSYNDGVIQIQP